MNAAWAGALGVVAGALVTGGIQIATTWLAQRGERRVATRQERKDIYLQALWEVHQLPVKFADWVWDDDGSERVAYGEMEFLSELSTLVRPLLRAEFELRLLGSPVVASAVEAYSQRFYDWGTSDLDIPKLIEGFHDLSTELDNRESEILALMRKELG